MHDCVGPPLDVLKEVTQLHISRCIEIKRTPPRAIYMHPQTLCLFNTSG